MVLVSNSDKEVIYKIIDGNEKYKGQITANRVNLSYNLKDKGYFTNHYETQAYRLIKRCLKT